jgi:hypothetical protein
MHSFCKNKNIIVSFFLDFTIGSTWKQLTQNDQNVSSAQRRWKIRRALKYICGLIQAYRNSSVPPVEERVPTEFHCCGTRNAMKIRKVEITLLAWKMRDYKMLGCRILQYRWINKKIEFSNININNDFYVQPWWWL